VLDALGLDRAALAGHSLGAAVALRVAACHPARVTALACVEGGVYDPKELFGTTWDQARTVMVRPSRGRITGAVLRAWLAGTALPPEALPAVLANYTPAGLDGALRLRLPPEAGAALAHDLWRQDPVPLLAGLRVPVLVLAARQGTADQDGPRRASIKRARAALGTRLTARWLSGGHDLPLERADRVAAALIGLMTAA
jgi:pimeloyl-ACP methyl ester carboxylesterase